MRTAHFFTRFSLLALIFFTLVSMDVPKGWFMAGSEPESYEMWLEKGAGRDKKNAASIKSIKETIQGFGTLMQKIKPDQYVGKRIRFSGFLKTKEAVAAMLWVRIDQEKSKVPLAFDNMSDRKVSGTTDWKQYEIVLDVLPGSSLISYGVILSGTGQIWFDEMDFEVVDFSYPLTGNSNPELIPDKPVNLDFEK